MIPIGITYQIIITFACESKNNKKASQKSKK